MYQYLKQQITPYLSLATRQGGIVLIGDVTAKSITFAISIIVMAYVSPEEYIVFGLFLTVLAIAAQFADAGVNLSFVRFYSLYMNKKPERADAHLHLAVRVKGIAFLLVGVIVGLTAPLLAGGLQYPELTLAFRILGVGILAVGLFEFLQVVYQARQDFKKLTALRVSEAFLKLFIIGWFALTSAFSLLDVYLSYVIAPAVVVAAVLVLSPVLRSKSTYSVRDIGGELYGFGKWLALSMLATMLMQHLDVLMIAPMLDATPGQSGLYYAAKKFCTPLQVLTTSLITVFYPKAMALTTVEEMRTYVKRTLRLSLPLSALLLLYLGALFVIVPAYFPHYTGALPVVVVLFIGWIWTLIGNPITILMLSINRANIATRISFVQLAGMVVSHYLFISTMGALGAAVSNLVLWFAAGSFTFWYIYTHRSDIALMNEATQ